MNDHPISSAPWRILILDPDVTDPKWILAGVASGNDVRPATPGAEEPDDVAATWAGGPLTRLSGARVWRVDQGR